MTCLLDTVLLGQKKNKKENKKEPHGLQEPRGLQEFKRIMCKTALWQVSWSGVQSCDEDTEAAALLPATLCR